MSPQRRTWHFPLLVLWCLACPLLCRKHPLNGRFTRNIEDYELSVPHSLTPSGDFQTFKVAHFFAQPERGRPKRYPEGADAVHLGVHVGDQLRHLVLWPNYFLASPDLLIETREWPNYRTSGFQEPPARLCYYQGHIPAVPNSRVALATCDGLVGSITLGQDQFFIEPLDEHEPNEEGHHLHVVYKRGSADDLDILFGKGAEKKCSTSSKGAQLRRKRSESESYSRYIETMVVCDKRFLEYHRDLNRERFILTVVNMAANYLHDTSIGQQIDLVLVRLLYLDKEERELDLNITHDARKTLESFCKWQQKFNPPDGNPAHADVALLFTRLDVCHGSDCEVVGQSFIGTACQRDSNCAYCEDNGLELGLVVAHQIGHLLGASDDDPHQSGCAQEDPSDRTPFVMSPSANLSAIRWSECSRRAVGEAFEQGLGDCLTDRPPPTPYIPKPVLPGVVYDWGAQCHLEVPGSTPCPSQESQLNICEDLRCLKPSKGAEAEKLQCFSLGKPPADGTKCDDNMWCFQGKCVKSGQRPETVDGDWSAWGEWAECSRPCGRGISYALRECNNPLPANGGRYCDGDKVRYKICNPDSCPENATSFRQQQCDAYNDVPDEEGHKHKYKAFLNPEAPCSLWCTTEDGENEELNSVVQDGTRCKPGKKSVCVNGECWKVGCDNMLNSAAVEDACGTCNGDGTGCKIIRDVFTEIGDKDYSTVAVLPTGIRKLSIEELAPSQNVIAITDKSEKLFFLNGKYTEQNDGVYKFGKVEGVYTHTAPNQEKLTIKGPLTEDLVFKVLFLKRENVGYQFQYAQLDSDNPDDAKFHWEVGDMSDCSARCGGGIQRGRLHCVEQKAGKVSDTFCIDLDRPDQPSQHCNLHPCPVKWRTGKWGECNACKGKPGVEKRGVECVEENPNPVGEAILVEDDRCPEPAPGTTKVCTSERPCKGKRYVHYIPHSHLGDVWVKMQPKPVKNSQLSRREVTSSLPTDAEEIDISGTKSTLPLVCETEGAAGPSASANLTSSTHRPGNRTKTYALDTQPANNSKLLVYPLEKTKDAVAKDAVVNTNKDPPDTQLENLEEDKAKVKTYKGKEAAKLFKELVKSGKDAEERQAKMDAADGTTSASWTGSTKTTLAV